MSLFGNILEKLGLKHQAASPAPAKPAATTSKPAPQAPPTTTHGPETPHFTRPAPQSPPPVTSKPQPTQARPPAQTPAPPSQQGKSTPSQPAETAQHIPQPQQPAAQAPAAAPAPMPMVDIVSKLDRMAAANPQKLNWKTSIVDLLKLLDLDSSYEARKELAVELGCPADMMRDSAQMNTWLHKTVMQKLAENGGNVPKELLD